MDWKLIDSSQTNIGNQNTIILKMQKEHRICNIKKELYLANKKNDNIINEWFEIRKVKSENQNNEKYTAFNSIAICFTFL